MLASTRASGAGQRACNSGVRQGPLDPLEPLETKKSSSSTVPLSFPIVVLASRGSSSLFVSSVVVRFLGSCLSSGPEVQGTVCLQGCHQDANPVLDSRALDTVRLQGRCQAFVLRPYLLTHCTYVKNDFIHYKRLEQPINSVKALAENTQGIKYGWTRDTSTSRFFEISHFSRYSYKDLCPFHTLPLQREWNHDWRISLSLADEHFGTL